MSVILSERSEPKNPLPFGKSRRVRRAGPWSRRCGSGYGFAEDQCESGPVPRGGSKPPPYNGERVTIPGGEGENGLPRAAKPPSQ